MSGTLILFRLVSPRRCAGGEGMSEKKIFLIESNVDCLKELLAVANISVIDLSDALIGYEKWLESIVRHYENMKEKEKFKKKHCSS